MHYIEMFKIFIVTIFCAAFVYSNASFVDNLDKCSIHDSSCHKVLYKSVLKGISKTGIEELGIPPIDPLHLKNISVSVTDFIDVTLLEGDATGIKDCVIENFETYIEKEFATMVLICDIDIWGRYKLHSENKILKSIFGKKSIHGEGYGKVNIQKLRIKFDFDFYIQRRDNNEIFLKCKNDMMLYTYEVLGKTTFAVENICIGNDDVTKPLVDLLNANSVLIMGTFGKAFMDKAMEFVYLYTHNFFHLVSTTSPIMPSHKLNED